MRFIRRYPELLILTAAAMLTRLWDVFSPVAVVFDEVYFKVYAGDYLTGAYYFDPHPPLGKMLLGAWAWLTHIDPTALTGDGPAVALRLLPALAGVLIIPVFYLFLRTLGSSRRVAALGGALLLLDNALLVESRFILIDSLLILFGLSAVTCFLAARQRLGQPRTWLLVSSVIIAGLAASTKWTGLTALGLIGVIWLFDQFRKSTSISWTRRTLEAIALVLIPIVVYFSVFWIHFSLLPKSGQGDAFMSTRFQTTLVGNANYDPDARMSIWDKFIDLNRAMSASESSLKSATHPYGSKWYSWPFMIRPIYYWQGETLENGTQGNIYLLGNPAVWWGILILFLGTIFASVRSLKRLRPYRFALLILILGYIMNFLPFSHIVRVMFLYHYLFALIYSLALAVILLGVQADWMKDSPHPWRFSNNTSRNLYFGIIAAAVIGFIYIAPLSYGFPLTPAELSQHIWLPSWR